MAAYVIFALGFAAGAAVSYRDMPLAAIGLAIALGLAVMKMAPPPP